MLRFSVGNPCNLVEATSGKPTDIDENAWVQYLTGKEMTQLKFPNCLAWTSRKGSDGYPRIRYKGKETRAHRLLYYLVHYGTNGMNGRRTTVYHLCGKKDCMNISHLDSY